MVNQNFLRTFRVLVQTGNFTRTAEQLHMTQSGVSQHIKKLETQLGQLLLNRYGKRFELTSAGELLFDFATKQLTAESELLQALEMDNIHVGQCKIACSGPMAMQLYPELLNLQTRIPTLTFSVEAAPNETIIELIKNNQFDLGIVTQQINDHALTQQWIGTDDLCLIVPKGKTVCWSSLISLGFINHPSGHHYAYQLLEKNFPHEFVNMSQLPERSYINQLAQILLPISQGIGFTVMPKSTIDTSPYLNKLNVVALQKSVAEDVYLVSKKHKPLAARYQLVTKLIKQLWTK
ncbi:LysR family transcriptional regulator [Zooshikella ganghwensis]|uniref:LysR family transcriptional regulator n=1 Tax=Zooshikella ganghwensis TaxID=202772 RepID=A0A4P9VQ09_9GAMM|nr:LysR family transcriptional regulator [Zooshikella ganghwensis]RDH44464.1 LysR family transcriptional regulator [Zooshikella ganghwensis]